MFVSLQTEHNTGEYVSWFQAFLATVVFTIFWDFIDWTMNYLISWLMN